MAKDNHNKILEVSHRMREAARKTSSLAAELDAYVASYLKETEPVIFYHLTKDMRAFADALYGQSITIDLALADKVKPLSE